MPPYSEKKKITDYEISKNNMNEDMWFPSAKETFAKSLLHWKFIRDKTSESLPWFPKSPWEIAPGN